MNEEQIANQALNMTAHGVSISAQTAAAVMEAVSRSIQQEARKALKKEAYFSVDGEELEGNLANKDLVTICPVRNSELSDFVSRLKENDVSYLTVRTKKDRELNYLVMPKKDENTISRIIEEIKRGLTRDFVVTADKLNELHPGECMKTINGLSECEAFILCEQAQKNGVQIGITRTSRDPKLFSFTFAEKEQQPAVKLFGKMKLLMEDHVVDRKGNEIPVRELYEKDMNDRKRFNLVLDRSIVTKQTSREQIEDLRKDAVVCYDARHPGDYIILSDAGFREFQKGQPSSSLGADSLHYEQSVREKISRFEQPELMKQSCFSNPEIKDRFIRQKRNEENRKIAELSKNEKIKREAYLLYESKLSIDNSGMNAIRCDLTNIHESFGSFMDKENINDRYDQNKLADAMVKSKCSIENTTVSTYFAPERSAMSIELDTRDNAESVLGMEDRVDLVSREEISDMEAEALLEDAFSEIPDDIDDEIELDMGE